MNHFTLVTVVTPSYNQGRFIEDTIQSIIAQDYPHIEHLVIDGGSRDNTLEILKKYEGRLTWVSESDNGQTDAINKGFRMAKGEIICWLNSDDTYEPGAIRKAVEFFDSNPDVMMVYGEGNEISEDGTFLHRFPYTQKYDLWALIYIQDYILQPTTFFRKKVFEEIDLPDQNLNWCMDWDLWIRIGQRYKVAYVDYVFANSRIYSQTKTGSGGGRRLQEIVSLMRKYGDRRYPLGCFLYGVDSFETICRSNYPLFYRFLMPCFALARKILALIQYQYQGVYSDGWLGEKAHFMIPIQQGVKNVRFELEALQVAELFPLEVQVVINNVPRDKRTVNKSGNFEIAVPLNDGDQGIPLEIEFKFSRYFVPNDDGRKLTCLLHCIEYLP